MSSKYKVPNLDRALTMMELMKENPKGMTLTEMATLMGVSQSSIYRISMTLLDRGFFHRDPKSKKFRMSNRDIVFCLSIHLVQFYLLMHNQRLLSI